ncbi:hypothetical protein CYY_000112 [Polysphondylium violaceum]|uniref:PH domain-containing protein n=1 Tax=Polysphondylium violaceum TaxID=133409 RepID=A0A8J4Q5B7_9MYCE|nr:hypothetical protein CYY_000112 [Polysphondylium violaceum]
MSTLDQYLRAIGLDSYQSILIDNGYDDPDIIAELTEDDLVAVGVKKGHAKRAFLKVKELSGAHSNASVSVTFNASPDTGSNSNGSGSITVTSTNSSSNNAPPPRASKISIGKNKDEDDDSDDDEKSPASYDGPILQSKVLYEGFLQKKGNEGFFGSKMWQKRYFKVYEEGRLAYYKHANVVSPINVIELRGSLNCDDMEGKPLAFKLSMKTSARVYYLLAPNADAKNKWAQVLKQHITPPVVPKKIDPNEIRPYLQHTEEPPQAASSRFDSPLSWDVKEKESLEGDLRLHIHSNGTVFAEETRTIEIDNEDGQVWIHNLPKTIDEKTVHFLSLTEPTAFVLEQNYYNDAQTPEKMLSKLIGKLIEIQVPRDESFEFITLKGHLIYLAKQKTYALNNKETNSVHFLKTTENISFNLLENELDPIFRDSSLEWTIKANEKKHLAKISYNSKDLFKWYANYISILNPRETEMEFRGWFTIKNKSGKTYEKTNVILVREPEEKTEEPKKEEEESSLPLPKLGGFKLGKLPGLSLGGSSAPPPAPEKRVYKYPVDHKTTLVDGESKQICFVSAKIPVKSLDIIKFDTPKYTKYASVGKDHGVDAKVGTVNSSVIFTWDKPYCLPAGEMKVQRYCKDNFGSDILNTFNLSHYNTGDIIVLPLQPLGRVSATRAQTGFNFDLDNLYIVETFEIKVMNGREEPVRVIVEENLHRWQFWEITYSSPKHTNHPTHSRKIQWTLNIPPLDGVTINYSVFYSGLSLPDSMLPKK